MMSQKLPNTAQIFETPKIIVLLLLFTLQKQQQQNTHNRKSTNRSIVRELFKACANPEHPTPPGSDTEIRFCVHLLSL